jgi:hypothetical protein
MVKAAADLKAEAEIGASSPRPLSQGLALFRRP